MHSNLIVKVYYCSEVLDISRLNLSESLEGTVSLVFDLLLEVLMGVIVFLEMIRRYLKECTFLVKSVHFLITC